MIPVGGKKQMISKLIVMMIVGFVSLTAQGQAGDSVYSHSGSKGIVSQQNQSYLNDRVRGTEPESFAVRDMICGSALPKKFSQEFQDMNRSFEVQQKYGLVRPFEAYEQANRNQQYGNYMLRSLLDYQLEENLKKAEKKSDTVRVFNQAHQTFKTITKASTKFELSPEFKFGTDTDLPGERGSIWMKSKIVNANMDAVFGPGFSMTSMAQKTSSESAATKDDHYRLNVSRDLGLWGLQTRMTYGFNTTRMNNSVSKSITKNLSAEVASTRGLNPGLSGMPKPEQSVRMSYGLSF